jgi:histidyl-tRNA synthetase
MSPLRRLAMALPIDRMSSDQFQPIQGMSDIAYPEISVWQNLESQARRLLNLYGFSEVRTPVVELRSVFERSLGDTTDVVQKEMYQFEDAGGRSLVLRPEGTAGITRYIAGLGQDGAGARVFYVGPMFRRERPQAGRKRQFHQFGAEAIGEANSHADAEMIAMQVHLLQTWGLKEFKIRVNTRGEASDRVAVQKGILELLQARKSELCEDCQRRMDGNVLRVLDCKNPKCKTVVASLPPMTTFMSESSRTYFDAVLNSIKRLELAVEVDPTLVRGLDYYQHTVWEISHQGLGAQDAIGAGGRYVINMGSREVSGVGFAMGMERIIMALTSEQGELKPPSIPLVWIVSMDSELLDVHLQLAQTLRMRGIACGIDLNGRSVKAQMKAAGRANARWAILHGLQEQEKGTFLLKDMESGSQSEVEMPELLERLKLAVIHAVV